MPCPTPTPTPCPLLTKRNRFEGNSYNNYNKIYIKQNKNLNKTTLANWPAPFTHFSHPCSPTPDIPFLSPPPQGLSRPESLVPWPPSVAEGDFTRVGWVGVGAGHLPVGRSEWQGASGGREA